jgi:hypothetical protein
MLQMITYTQADGKKALTGYVDKGSAYQLTGKRERFAQLMAQGHDAEQAYCEAFNVELRPDTVQDINRKAKALCHDTAIVLRIHDLKQPVLRKVAKKIEYNLNKALEQCQVAYDLAFIAGDSKGLLKAVEMQARLSKLLSEEINVTHRHGVLDDAATEVLLAMRKEIEGRRERAKKLGVVVEGDIVTGAGTPQGPASGEVSRVP